MDLGLLFKDTESVVLAWGTDGLSLTNAEAIANTTSIEGDAPWDVTRHTYLRSVAATRLTFTAAYLFVNLTRSITNPDEVKLTFRHTLATDVVAATTATAATTTTLTSNHTRLISESARS